MAWRERGFWEPLKHLLYTVWGDKVRLLSPSLSISSSILDPELREVLPSMVTWAIDEVNIIRDAEGNTPTITMATSDWTGWFGLNADVTLIPVDTEFFAGYDMLNRDKTQEEITTSGQFVDINWAANPDWYRHNNQWRGWIPVKDINNNLPCPNYLDFNKSFPYTKIHDTYCPAWPLAWWIVERYSHLNNLVVDCPLIDLHDKDYIVATPERINAFDFDTGYYMLVPELQQQATRVKRGIVDCLGWLYWLVGFVPSNILESHLLLNLLEQVHKETEITYQFWGYILRLANCWTRLNIPLWLSNRILIFYNWTLEDQLLLQLVCINPKFIAGDTSKNNVLLHNVNKDEELLRLARVGNNYDDYFQEKVPSLIPWGHLSFEMDSNFFVINFKGWKWRPIPRNVTPGIYSTLFYFRILWAEGEEESYDMIFWRWRKKKGAKASPVIDKLTEAKLNESH